MSSAGIGNLESEIQRSVVPPTLRQDAQGEPFANRKLYREANVAYSLY